MRFPELCCSPRARMGAVTLAGRCCHPCCTDQLLQSVRRGGRVGRVSVESGVGRGTLHFVHPWENHPKCRVHGRRVRLPPRALPSTDGLARASVRKLKQFKSPRLCPAKASLRHQIPSSLACSKGTVLAISPSFPGIQCSFLYRFTPINIQMRGTFST